MKFLSRFHIHRVENDVIVDVVGVSVSGNQRLIASEVLGEAQTDLVSRFGREIIVGTEGLNDVNVGPAVLFFELLFHKREFLKHRIEGAVDARNEIFIGLFQVHHVGENVIHWASRSNEFNDCHIFSSSFLVSVRLIWDAYPALTARVSWLTLLPMRRSSVATSFAPVMIIISFLKTQSRTKSLMRR